MVMTKTTELDVDDEDEFEHARCCAAKCDSRPSDVQLSQQEDETAAELWQLQHADADFAPLIEVLTRGKIQPMWNEVASWSAASKSPWRRWGHSYLSRR